MSSFPLTNSYFSRLLKPPTSIPRTNLCLSHSLSWAVYLNMFLLFAEGFFPLVYIVIRIPDDMPGTGISKARHGKTWQDMARHGKTWQDRDQVRKRWRRCKGRTSSELPTSSWNLVTSRLEMLEDCWIWDHYLKNAISEPWGLGVILKDETCSQHVLQG